MHYLTKAEILAVDDIPREEVEVPEWGGVVVVRGMTGAELGALTAALFEQRGSQQVLRLQDVYLRLCATCIIDPDTGQRMFDDHEVAALARKSGVALMRVGRVAQRLSGLSEDQVEEFIKDSGPTQDGGSLSG